MALMAEESKAADAADAADADADADDVVGEEVQVDENLEEQNFAAR